MTAYRGLKENINRMDAIIMSAGLGTRMGDLTKNTPKPLIPVAGKGSLERTLDALPPQISRVIIVVNYLAEQIIKKIGAESHGRPVAYAIQEPLDGTGGCLRAVIKQVPDLSERFMVINGDDLYAAEDLARLAEAPVGLLTLDTIAPRTIDSCAVKDGRLLGYTETPKGERGIINIGAYVLDHRWFETDPVLVPGKTTEWSLPHAIPQLLAKDIAVMAVQATFWMPVGTPEELKNAEAFFNAT